MVGKASLLASQFRVSWRLQYPELQIVELGSLQRVGQTRAFMHYIK
ncbi:hypothetical protein SAMN05421863_101330 [Nitrosomonas communis]|uniref:Uncharacterized protein n=1 Tax=Nitrosomonas communis TaxID=44574 RepID=A0A1I4N4T1_9PROT|nr:hypothetical protein SAMN05421863_101330 [Nitrosomonas communis]